MLTLEEIKRLDLDLDVDIKKAKEDFNLSTDSRDRKVKRLANKKEYLRIIKMYLETSPSIDYLIKEKKRITERIHLIMEGYETWLKNQVSKGKSFDQLRKEFESVNEIPKLRSQLKNVNFILKQ